ncbi:MAG: hypothetical protein LVO36_03365 [Nitrosopumilus sp. (ex Thoosa mismalolli)]|nr:hypothetical protein [Nitrosopumilus sp. (ex Thoosa mismalolli)]
MQKTRVVQHGGNVNMDNNLELNFIDVGVESYDKFGNKDDKFSGSSFASPLFTNKIAQIERKYREKITNVESFLAISYSQAINNNSKFCWGYGELQTFVESDKNTALYVSEGTIGFTETTETEFKTPYNEISVYVPPRTTEIKLCLVHSDNLKKAVRPTLETFFEVKAKKYGNDQLIHPRNREDGYNKSNVKILTYAHEQKSMESIWTFRIKPRTVNPVEHMITTSA